MTSAPKRSRHGIVFRFCLSLLVALPATKTFLSQTQPRVAAEPAPNIAKDVAVPMRDGVILRADVLLPKGAGRFPTLVYRTPYNKESALRTAKTFSKAVARGYAVVLQDVRGRYASDGEFNAYRNEGHDGYDTIEWAAKQSWSDGNVGTFGLSYPGAVQWLAAVENPPHLKAMVPAMTFSTPRNFIYSGGLFDGSWIDWIWFNIAPDIRSRKGLPGPKTHKEAAEAWEHEHQRLQEFLPLRDLPDLKDISPFYYEWLSHPAADPWWDWAELRNKYGRVHAAVLNFSGWYDEAYGPDGATTNFNGLLAARRNEKDPRTRTVLGPWTHGGEEESRSGEREFGPSAPIDYDELILRWMATMCWAWTTARTATAACAFLSWEKTSGATRTHGPSSEHVPSRSIWLPSPQTTGPAVLCASSRTVLTRIRLFFQTRPRLLRIPTALMEHMTIDSWQGAAIRWSLTLNRFRQTGKLQGRCARRFIFRRIAATWTFGCGCSMWHLTARLLI